MTYDPTIRGPHPVGVTTVVIPFESGELEVEMWYPAGAHLAGMDLDGRHQDQFIPYQGAPATSQSAVRDAPAAELDRLPLILCSHGGLSHRRAMTSLCCHMASHGYMVASPDHIGSLYSEYLQKIAAEADAPEAVGEEASATRRPRELAAILRHFAALPAGERKFPGLGRVGAVGASFGGWTTIQSLSAVPEIEAIVPLVPAYGAGPLLETSLLGEGLQISPSRHVSKLLIAGEYDAFVAPENVSALFDNLPGPKRLHIVANIGHNHFVDDAANVHELLRQLFACGLLKPTDPSYAGDMSAALRPFGELLSEAAARDYVNGITVAFFDSTLKTVPAANMLLDNGLDRWLGQIGVTLKERSATT